jgi:hypothetical protein
MNRIGAEELHCVEVHDVRSVNLDEARRRSGAWESAPGPAQATKDRPDPGEPEAHPVKRLAETLASECFTR